MPAGACLRLTNRSALFRGGNSEAGPKDSLNYIKGLRFRPAPRADLRYNEAMGSAKSTFWFLLLSTAMISLHAEENSWLSVTVEPKAEIILDGQKLTNGAPVRKHQVQPGSHELQFISKELKMTSNFNVHIPSSRGMECEADLNNSSFNCKAIKLKP